MDFLKNLMQLQKEARLSSEYLAAILPVLKFLYKYLNPVFE